MRQGCTECTRTVSARRRNRLPSACRSGCGSPPPAASWWSAPPAGRPGRRIPGKCDTVPQPCRHCPCSWQSRCCPPACGTASRCPAPAPDCSACFARFPALPAPRSERATPAPHRRMRPTVLAGHRQSCPDPAPVRRHPAGRSRQVLLPCGALRRSAPAGRQAGCARSAGRSPVTVPWRAGERRVPIRKLRDQRFVRIAEGVQRGGALQRQEQVGVCVPGEQCRRGVDHVRDTA